MVARLMHPYVMCLQQHYRSLGLEQVEEVFILPQMPSPTLKPNVCKVFFPFVLFLLCLLFWGHLAWQYWFSWSMFFWHTYIPWNYPGNKDRHFPKYSHELFFSLSLMYLPIPSMNCFLLLHISLIFFYHYISVGFCVHGSSIMSSFVSSFFYST